MLSFTRPSLILAAWVSHAALAADVEKPMNFINDVQPILTKAHCNSGGCHAKADVGQRGFRLSLLGFEPEEDYEHIVKESKGRRVMPSAPEQSLLITKATNQTPHGGGKKVEPDSVEYQTLVRWVSQGMPYAAPEDPVLATLDVEPKAISMKPNSKQSLKVTARYTDGSTRDVTGMALFEANDTNMAATTDQGEIKALDIPGNVAIMVRYSGKFAVSKVTIPLGAPVENLPPEVNFIDKHIFANLKRIGIPPSNLTDDATFLRRVSLDIAGRLPTVEETKAFLASQEANKRAALVDRLLDSPDYADYFANKWTAMLKNKRDDAADITANFAFHAWMRDSLLANTSYDDLVRQILASSGTIVSNPPVAWYKRVKEPNQQLEDVAQLFLGVRMQCAQCHHHPFERWSQHDYYSFSAFFSQVGRKPTAIAGEDLIFHKRGVAQIENKKTRQPVKPAALGAPTLDIAPDEDPRLQLADWMSDPSNPFFAKSLVNRYWKHFFKRGLVEPEDDIRDSNPPSNPELFEELAHHFIEQKFDLKALIRTIVLSSTYQLESKPNSHNVVDRQNFSYYYPKRLQAEVLLDAMDLLTAAPTDFANLPPETRAISLPDNSYNKTSPFLKVFGRPEGASVCECERVQSSSLAQSLHLMNANDVKTKLSKAGGRADNLNQADLSPQQRIRELYLAAFSREPDLEEMEIAQEFLLKPRLDAKGAPLTPPAGNRQAIEDLIWALMNTKEFMFNH